MKKFDALSVRMKDYESSFKRKLTRRMFTVIRVDGRSFKNYTSKLQKPFDKGLVDDMIATTKYLCANIQGCKLGYVQSDEISLVLTDFDELTTEAWFDNDLQKMCSISASLVTGEFNRLRIIRSLNSSHQEFLTPYFKIANFDARIYQLPNFQEVNNYLIWRSSRDCVRNSISGAAQSLYSTSELHGKNTSHMQEMIFQKGSELKKKLMDCGYLPNDFLEPGKLENFNWNDLPAYLKRGTTIVKAPFKKYFSKEIYDKDKNKEDWHGEMIEDEYLYFKYVDQWTAESTDYTNQTDSYLTLGKAFKIYEYNNSLV